MPQLSQKYLYVCFYIIMVSHDLKDLTRNCDVAFLVRDGKAEYFDNVQDAVGVYKAYAS